MSNFQIDEAKIDLNNIKIQMLDFIVDFDKLQEDDKQFIISGVNKICGYKLINLHKSLEQYKDRC